VRMIEIRLPSFSGRWVLRVIKRSQRAFAGRRRDVRVVNETFRVVLTRDDQIEAARLVQVAVEPESPLAESSQARKSSRMELASRRCRVRGGGDRTVRRTPSDVERQAQDLAAAAIAPGLPTHVDREIGCTDSRGRA